MNKILTFALCSGLMLALGNGCPPKKQIKEPDKPQMDADSGSMKNYLVRRGDSLWKIAGKGDVLGDAFQWPLLYKSNRDQIEDPDLIDVRQDLAYKDTYSREEIQDAVQKAKDTPPYVPHSTPRRVLPVKY